jgi:hypothetical protein
MLWTYTESLQNLGCGKIPFAHNFRPNYLLFKDKERKQLKGNTMIYESITN